MNFVSNPLGEGLLSVIVSTASSCHGLPSSTRRAKKIPKPTLKASLLVPTRSGEGFESLLEHDSKAHPPFLCPWNLEYMHIQLLEVWAKRDDVHASGFKVSLMHTCINLELSRLTPSMKTLWLGVEMDRGTLPSSSLPPSSPAKHTLSLDAMGRPMSSSLSCQSLLMCSLGKLGVLVLVL